MKKIIFLTITVLTFYSLSAQEHPEFKITKQNKTTPVKDQGMTGTCWSYATTSFIESEALRMGKGELDLSEMYIVRNAYLNKAKYYLRLNGLQNFSQGGQAHDVTNVASTFGLMPESSYSGLVDNKVMHNHMAMEGKLKSIVENINKEKDSDKLNPDKKYIYTLDSVMGEVPKELMYNNKKISPKEYMKNVVGFNSEDYIEFTSYSHHKFYTWFSLEVPDNWSHDSYFNLPVDDLMKVMNYALENGYTIAWDGDVSETGFKHQNGKAELSVEDYAFLKKENRQQYRQTTFDNFKTTDDHLMHITGLAKNKEGKTWYLTKNSWGPKSNKYGGYLYMSEDYVKIKTVAFMVHKNAVPKNILEKIK